MTDDLAVWGLHGLPEVRSGDDLGAVIAAAEPDLRDGDILVVTSKVVSKAEGQSRSGDRETAIDDETARIVARRGATRIVQTRHGFVLAAAGVDASNTDPGMVVLLPRDPDASARRLCAALRERLGVTVAVIISDSFGRPWRVGLTDVALGLAGIDALDDLRGHSDAHGNVLDVTVTAVADEITGAADLVKGKLSGVPVAVVRGLADRVSAADGAGARTLVRPADEDMFRYGSRDVVTARRTAREFSDDAVPPDALRRAVGAAVTAPVPGKAPVPGNDTAGHGEAPWRFVLVGSTDARKRLLDAVVDEGSAQRVADSDVVRRAPALVVPCLLTRGGDDYPETLGAHAPSTETGREQLVAVTGAAIENFLVALAAEGLGSYWALSTVGCPENVRAELDLPPAWEPMGVVAVGYPSTPPPERPPSDPDEFLLYR